MSSLTFRPKPIDLYRSIPVLKGTSAIETCGISRSVPQLPTGMEPEEEEEHHIQEAISTRNSKTEIPTPEFQIVSVPKRRTPFERVAGVYLRYLEKISDDLLEGPVEYDLEDEDVKFLEFVNNSSAEKIVRYTSDLALKLSEQDLPKEMPKKNRTENGYHKIHLTEDQLEWILDRLEKEAYQNQKSDSVTFQAAENICRAADTVGGLNSGLRSKNSHSSIHTNITLVRAIYYHWKYQRKIRNDHFAIDRLNPIPNQNDPSPFVAFRPRENRLQSRFSRKNDQQSFLKLKQLRHDFERARMLLETIKKREKLKRDRLCALLEIVEAEAKEVLLHHPVSSPFHPILLGPFQQPPQPREKRKKIKLTRTDLKDSQSRSEIIPSPPSSDHESELSSSDTEMPYDDDTYHQITKDKKFPSFLNFSSALDTLTGSKPFQNTSENNLSRNCHIVPYPGYCRISEFQMENGSNGPFRTSRNIQGRRRIGRGGRVIYDRAPRLPSSLFSTSNPFMYNSPTYHPTSPVIQPSDSSSTLSSSSLQTLPPSSTSSPIFSSPSFGSSLSSDASILTTNDTTQTQQPILSISPPLNSSIGETAFSHTFPNSCSTFPTLPETSSTSLEQLDVPLPANVTLPIPIDVPEVSNSSQNLSSTSLFLLLTSPKFHSKYKQRQRPSRQAQLS